MCEPIMWLCIGRCRGDDSIALVGVLKLAIADTSNCACVLSSTLPSLKRNSSTWYTVALQAFVTKACSTLRWHDR